MQPTNCTEKLIGSKKQSTGYFYLAHC